MTARLMRTLLWSSCLVAMAAAAGEIVILQPAPGDAQSRNARESERAMDKARQRVGKAGAGMTTIIVGDETMQKRDADRNREASQDASDDARDYLRTAPADGYGDGGGTVILRTAPVRESERLQQRARSYIAPNAAPTRRDCSSNVSSQIGVIGEGPGATRGNVLERGTSSVDAQGCR